MKVAFDGIMLHQVVRQLQPLVGGRISKIYQISDTEVLFLIKAGNIRQLMVSAHSTYNRIHLTDRSYPSRSAPSNFVMLLRKYLEGGYVSSIEQAGLDRYLIMEISSRNELGDRIVLQLYIELMGKYANLILVSDGRIIDALKHIPPFENTIRTIQPGAQFKPTAPQPGKTDPFAVSRIEGDENLFEKLEGFSPLLSDEVSYRMHHGQSYAQIMTQIAQSDQLYITSTKKGEFFHCLPLTHLSSQYRQYEICEGLDQFYYSKEEKERIRHISGDLFKFVRKEISRTENKIDKLSAQLLEAEGCDIYRRYGETLYANLDKVDKGMTEVRIQDFEGNDLTIPLDNKLDGRGNAKKHFTRYHKLSTGKKYINEQLQIARDNLEYFSAVSQQLQQADFTVANEIKQELQNNGYLKADRRRVPHSKKPPEPAYLSIEAGEHVILVGRNNIQNNYVTFKKAGRFDTWFHAKDVSGGHVVINTDKPNEQEIRLCAMLAAWFSLARESSSIPVDYTLIRELKKIPNSKLGKVIMKQYRTIYIDIDEKTLSQYIDMKK
ncbi:MAG: NFACT family protein [Erysipelotrichaceae bacterium]|nr:NFACT family protein [Erysipelotrichaceae bacterium]